MRARSLQLGVLVSGSGTNLQAILDEALAGRIAVKVRVVVSNKPGVLALERARRAGVPTEVLPHRAYSSREAFDEALVDLLRRHGVEWVALAGFMRVLTPRFLQAFSGRVVNIHPALLPSFPGLHAQRQALERGVMVSGCTVHFVDEGTDTGPIIGQAVVPVLVGDDEESLAHRILAQEHRLYPLVLNFLAEGRVTRREGRVQLEGLDGLLLLPPPIRSASISTDRSNGADQ